MSDGFRQLYSQSTGCTIHGWIELTSRSALYSGTFNIKAPSTRAQSEVYGASSISPGFSAFMKGTPHSQASRLKKLSM